MDHFYDAVIVGGGPAGLTAALYLARAKYRVLVAEKEQFGGQITITSEMVNFPGVYKTSGKELTETMRKQAEGFGAEFLLAEVTGLNMAGRVRKVITSRGEISCFGILLATGAHPRKIGFEGEEEFRGHAARMQKITGLKPQRTEAAGQEASEMSKKEDKTNHPDGALFDPDMTAQLKTVFSRMERPLILKLYLDAAPLSGELKSYMEEVAGLTDKLTVEVANSHEENETPCVRILSADQTDTGLAFHGVMSVPCLVINEDQVVFGKKNIEQILDLL